MSDLASAQRIGRLKLQKVQEAYRRLFDTPDGKIVLAHIMKTGFLLRTTFVINDPYATMLNEGTRRLALAIVKGAGINEQYIQENYNEIMATGSIIA